MKVPAVMRRRAILLAVSLSLLAAGAPSTRAAEEVIVQVGTGDYGRALEEAYVKTFEAETGIDVIVVNDWADPNKAKLWYENESAEWDVALLGGASMALGGRKGWLAPVDYGLFDQSLLADVYPTAKATHGFGAVFYSSVIAYYPGQFPNGAPKDWAEFWNVERFPGKRTLVNGQAGYGPWYYAALADGVPIEELYPLDIERAFASLARIKPHISKWWQNGSENQQLFADKLVDIGEAYNGRIANLQKEGMPIVLNWNQGKMEVDYWVVPTHAKNPANAQKFLSHTIRPDLQAKFARMISYGTSNSKMTDLLDEETRQQLPTNPAFAAVQFFRNYEWEAEIGADGKSNLERLIERWNKFILED